MMPLWAEAGWLSWTKRSILDQEPEGKTNVPRELRGQHGGIE